MIMDYLRKIKNLQYEKLVSYVWNDKEVQQQIISLNTHTQLNDLGIDSEGVSLGDYSPVSVQKYGKPEGHIRLYDTGEFYESFKVVVNGINAEITAKTQKEDVDLAEEYGKQIIGLTNESKEVLTKVIIKVLKKRTRELLQVNR